MNRNTIPASSAASSGGHDCGKCDGQTYNVFSLWRLKGALTSTRLRHFGLNHQFAQPLAQARFDDKLAARSRRAMPIALPFG